MRPASCRPDGRLDHCRALATCCLNQYRSAPAGTARRQGVSAVQGTRMAHMCHRWQTAPLVVLGENAGRPACFADGSTVDRGAPKGIRNLPCGCQRGSVGRIECRIVAGQRAYAVPASFIASEPDSGCLSALPAHKAREWHADASRHFRTVPPSAWARLSRSKVSPKRGNSNSREIDKGHEEPVAQPTN